MKNDFIAQLIVKDEQAKVLAAEAKHSAAKERLAKLQNVSETKEKSLPAPVQLLREKRASPAPLKAIPEHVKPVKEPVSYVKEQEALNKTSNRSSGSTMTFIVSLLPSYAYNAILPVC